MPVAVAVPVFLAGVVVSLATSYLLVTRLERLGERLGLTEGLLGVVAALAADAPEITSAITALTQHQQKIGAGVVIGSNVFNLAALLGLGAVTAGSIALHRKVVLLGGLAGIWVAAACLVSAIGLVPPVAGLALALVVLVPYIAVLGAGGPGWGACPSCGAGKTGWPSRSQKKNRNSTRLSAHPEGAVATWPSPRLPSSWW